MKQILGPAASRLDEGEQVLEWVRAEHPEDKREGFLVLTERRFIVRWTGKERNHHAVAWSDVASWGVSTRRAEAPVVGVEGAGASHVALMPATSGGTARRIERFVARLHALAPQPRRVLTPTADLGPFSASPAVEVMPPKRSPADRWRRILVTVLGVLLLCGGVLLLVLPGPGILLIIAGFGVLAGEYDWAKDALAWAKQRSTEATNRVKQRRKRSPQE